VHACLTLHAVHDDEGAVGDTQGGSDHRAEVDVARAVNQVYQVVIALAFACARSMTCHRYPTCIECLDRQREHDEVETNPNSNEISSYAPHQ
jgi:hypothetical protein